MGLHIVRRCISLFLLALLGAATAALAAESRSDEFIKQAIEGNLFEIQAGKLAQAKGASDAVRKFGTLLTEDHTQARDKSIQTAKSIGVAAPTTPSGTQRAVLEALSQLEGVRFDERFIASMLDDHLRDVARYESQAKQGDDAVSRYAAEALPRLRDHLKAAQGMRNERSTR